MPAPSTQPSPSREAVSSQPIFYAALALSAGIAFSARAWRPPLWWMAAALIVLLIGLVILKNRPRFAMASALASVFAVGALLWQLEAMSAAPSPDLARFEDQKVTLVAHVTNVGLVRHTLAGAKDEQRELLDVESESIADANGIHPLVTGVRVSLFANVPSEDSEDGSAPGSAMPAVHYGDRVQMPAHV